MKTAMYPGTFDPITFGHIDIAVRALQIFPRVIAVVAENPAKNTLFSVDERLEMVREAFEDKPCIEVIKYSGLIVNCLREHNASVLIRGLRALSDFEYEFQMAFTNRTLLSSSETVFLTPSAEYIYLNSTMVKQIAKLNGNVTPFVPGFVKQKLIEKFKPGN
ncbi:MAG: pantetheine-phosphate adenylyltransferase [Fibrobacter sp.]|nr:pantetheine-phosphate adenylyltransferase [Fibrobacter sp.]